MTLTEQIKLVAELREKAHRAREAERLAREVWEAENIVMISETEKTKTDLSEAETQLREMTIEAYNETGNKQPADGVGIRVSQTLEYDEKDAFAWAIEHKMALQLNKKSFESLAKDNHIDFVTSHEKLTATIATDLSNYLE